MTDRHPTPADDRIVEVAVVGGGQAGLAMGYHLRERGIEFVILEAAAEIGRTWRSRWDTLRLFTPARYAGLPGMPLPVPPDSYPGKDQIADYLADYVAAFDLPVRLHARAAELRRTGGVFRLATTSGTVRARQVVVATGPFQAPLVPDLAAGLAEDIVQLHSSAYRNARDAPAGDVMVVGGGNSGFHIAAELASTVGAGHGVTLAEGTRNAVVPQRPFGRDIFWWQTVFGLVTAPATTRRGRLMRQGESTVIGMTRRRLRSCGVDLRPRLVDAHGHAVSFADGQTRTLRSGSCVVWATGYRCDHSWIQIPGLLDERYRLRHNGGVTPEPGLFVLGQPWQRTSGSALIGYVGGDAAYLAGLIGQGIRRAPTQERGFG